MNTVREFYKACDLLQNALTMSAFTRERKYVCRQLQTAGILRYIGRESQGGLVGNKYELREDQ